MLAGQPVADHPDACGDERDAKSQKREIPAQRCTDVIADVVQPENVMVDDAFDHVEHPPACREQTGEHPAPARAVNRHAIPEERQSGDRRNPGERMEHPVREGVVLQPCDRRHRETALGGEHVVPLQDLVEDDAVDKSSKANPQENASGDELFRKRRHAAPAHLKCSKRVACALSDAPEFRPGDCGSVSPSGRGPPATAIACRAAPRRCRRPSPGPGNP